MNSVAFVLTAVGAFGFAGIMGGLRRGSPLGRRPTVLRFRYNKAVDVVLTTTATVADKTRQYTRYVTSAGNLQAATVFSETIGSLRLRHTTRIQLSEKLVSDLGGDLVVIGGPDRNEI